MSWSEGDILEPTVKPAITKDQLRAYAKASGDDNRIHLDDGFAKEAGFPSVIAHGMLSMAFLSDHLVRHFPEQEYQVVKIRTRFRKIIFPEDVITCEGKIRRKQDDGHWVVSLTAKNQRGEVASDGEAEVSPKSS